MAINFLDNVQFNQNQLLGARLQVETADANVTSPVSGQIIYNSTTNKFKYYDGTNWIDPTVGTYTGWSLDGDTGGAQVISNGVTVDVQGGTGVSTATNSGGASLKKVVITNSLPFNSLTLASTTGSSSTILNSETITLAAGAGITTTNNGSGQVTIAATGAGSMNSFTLSGDAGANQTISDGNTLKIAGGTLISTTASATDTLTVNHNNVTRSNTTASETLTAGSSFGVITSASTTGQGHVTGTATTTFTLPSATANTTYTLPVGGGGNSSTLTLTGSDSSTDVVTISGTTNQIGVSTTNAAALQIGLPTNVTVAGNLTVGGGGITLNSTGRIQGVDTVTSATDAANKAYVDSSVAGGLTVKGGFNANTGVIVAGGNLTSGTERVAIQVGDYYIVTVAGNFFANAATPLTPGDSVLCQTAANIGNSVEPDFAVIQSDTDLATISTVGIGNVNINGAGNKDGLSLSYATGTATLGLDVSGLPQLTGSSLPIADGDSFVVYDTSAVANKRVLFSDIKAAVSSSFKGTSTSGTTHTFTHNLATSDVIVQLYNNAGGSSFGETVYASVDRTSTNVVTVTTAASANIRCLIQGL